MALGVAEFIPEIKEYHLEDKDLLTLYTDGVIEAQTKEYTLYGEKRLQEVIRKMKSKTAQELVLAIEESIREFANGKPQHDDITLVALRPLIK
jgi:sigma-B regulation protein RsbU (phosphoserine phosphatase)